MVTLVTDLSDRRQTGQACLPNVVSFRAKYVIVLLLLICSSSTMPAILRVESAEQVPI